LSPLGLDFDTAGGRQILQCWNITGILRLIQSIPSKNAEPFKRWLAKVGHQRIQEIENPELAQDRAKEYYEKKGYPESWIDKRLRGIAIRQDLTDEWKQRGVKEGREFAILTNEISQATFGIPIKEHKEIKNLDPKFKNENLRDHMDDLELIFNMLGEASTTKIARKKDAQGFIENKDVAKRGGAVAGTTRKQLEIETGDKIASKGSIETLNNLCIRARHLLRIKSLLYSCTSSTTGR
jgi:DNA-damage-inducible protein D